jgi:hypothetical protein
MTVSRRTWYAAMGMLAVGLAALVAAAGLFLAGGGGDAEAAPAAGSDGADWRVEVAPLGEGGALVVLVSPTRQRLMVYRVDDRRTQLKLLAVRDVGADWALTDYNNERPLPQTVREWVLKAAGPGGTGETPSGAP